MKRVKTYGGFVRRDGATGILRKQDIKGALELRIIRRRRK